MSANTGTSPTSAGGPASSAAETPPVPFSIVVAAELDAIRARRQSLLASRTGDPVDDLSGLALSGGGIRSATFCLGVLQALERAQVLTVFDYLSTVSGGGFVGSWWTAWLTRQSTTGFFPRVERIVLEPTPTDVGRREIAVDRASAGTDPVHHLRLFSNYLTPKKGALSADTWRAVAVVSRNLGFTWAILLPILIGVILVADCYFVSLDATWLSPAAPRGHLLIRLKLAAVPLVALYGWIVALTLQWMQYGRERSSLAYATPFIGLAIVFMLAVALFYQSPASGASTAATAADALWVLWSALRQWFAALDGWPLVWLAVWAVAAGGLLAYAARWRAGDDSGELIRNKYEVIRNQIVRVHSTLLVVLVLAAAALAVAGFSHEIADLVFFGQGFAREVAAAGGWVSIVTSAAGAVYTAWRTAPSPEGETGARQPSSGLESIALAGTPPAVLAVVAVLLGWGTHSLLWQLYRHSDTAEPILRLATMVAVLLCALYAWHEADGDTSGWRGASGLKAGAVWLLATGLLALLRPDLRVVGALIGISVWTGLLTSVVALVRRRRATAPANLRPLRLLATGFAAIGIIWLLRRFDSSALVAFLFLGTLAAWLLAYGWLADPNLLSLHAFYKERLTRAYLGASNVARSKKAIDIVDAVGGDDLLLAGAHRPDRGAPYHLINTTLNLTSGRDLGAAQRSSDRFLLSPLYCGSGRTLYRHTTEYMGGTLSLGTAVAVSGAAVSPEMGAVSPTAALAMLMTLLNVRLGYWAPTPNKGSWTFPSASLWPFYLLNELLSQTNELGSYCYLTDGGHFDNTGVYTLIERGCRNILMVDCGADPNSTCEDLGEMIRRVRIDFGTTINLDLDAVRRDKTYAKSCVTVGSIDYSAAHWSRLGRKGAPASGVLAVIKPALTGSEVAADVRQYGFQHPEFPQQSTANQWFDEAQFESYRRLGELGVDELLRLAAPSQRPLLGAGVNEWFDGLLADAG